MTVVTLDENAALTGRTNYDMQVERDPTFGETAKAFFENENLIFNVANKIAQPDFKADPAYDFFADDRTSDPRYVGFLDRAVGIESREEADNFFANVDREKENKNLIQASGVEGMVAGMAVGMADPTMLIPLGGAAYKTYRTSGRILEGAARTGVMTGAAVGAEELLLQSTQETRTAEESAWNIGGGVFLGGIVGGALGALSKKQFAELATRVDEELQVPVDPYRETSVGAASAPTTSLRDEGVKGITGLDEQFDPTKPGWEGWLNRRLDYALNPEKGLAFQDPLLRMANSVSKTSRTSMEKLAELSLVRNKNTKGIASEISVENRIKGYELPKYLYLKDRDKLFLQYRQSKSKMATNLGDFATNAGDRVFNRSRQDGKLTFQEFKEEIARAGRRGDTHEIPEVAEAARLKRKNLTDPIFNEAKAVGLIDEDVKNPGTAQSYVNRLWDNNAIKANRKEFEDINTKWLIQKRDKAASDLEAQFKSFDLEAGPVAEVVKAERASLRAAQSNTRQAVKKEVKAGEKVESIRLSIDELETRLKDATANQQRIYEKILNRRARGDENLQDLFFEFKSVSSQKKDLYKRLTAKEGEGDIKNADFWRRERIANQLDEAENELATRLAYLEDQTKLMEDLEYKAGFEDGELNSVAYKLVDRILGTSVGRLSYDNKMRTPGKGNSAGKRGPAKARVYDIPDEMVEKFLVNDDDHLVESYVRSLSSDIELTRAFGSVDPEDALKAIQDDYEAIERHVKDKAQLERLRNAKNDDLRDFKAVWERLRGTYGNSGTDDYAGGWKSTERVLMNLNYLSMLGGMTISAFTDVARPVMVHGVSRVLGDGIAAAAGDWKMFKAAAQDVKESGTALDMVTNTRAKALFGLDETAPFVNKAEAVTGAMSQNFGVISLMAPWNAGMKQFSGVVTQSRMLRSIQKMSQGGEIDGKELEYLAANFIDPKMAKRIADQFAEHGEETDRVLVPNARAWSDRQAQETFRAAVRRQVDQIIVTPGQDKPLWMSKSGWKLMGQFRSFAFASTQRTMLAGLQQRDAAVLNGTLMSIAMGSLTYMVKSNIAGKETDMSPENLIREGVDRSGVLGWLTDANAIVEKLSRGRVGMNAVMGGPTLSRYASRSALEAVFGPTYGMAGNLTQVAGNAFAGDWTASDTRTMRRLMPYNNLFYLRSIFDQAETNINDYFGVKGK